MKGMDPQFCQHQISSSTNVKPVQHRRHMMNPNYAEKVKEVIDKLVHVGGFYASLSG